MSAGREPEILFYGGLSTASSWSTSGPYCCSMNSRAYVETLEKPLPEADKVFGPR